MLLTVAHVGMRSHLFNTNMRCLCGASFFRYFSTWGHLVPWGSRASSTCINTSDESTTCMVNNPYYRIHDDFWKRWSIVWMRQYGKRRVVSSFSSVRHSAGYFSPSVLISLRLYWEVKKVAQFLSDDNFQTSSANLTSVHTILHPSNWKFLSISDKICREGCLLSNYMSIMQ